MFIKYFVYSSAAVLLSILLTIVGLLCYMRLRHLKKLAVINVLRRQQNRNEALFFSTPLIKTAVKKLFFSSGKKARQALIFLVGGRPAPAAEYFKESSPEISLLLAACDNSIKGWRRIIRQSKLLKNPQFRIYAALLAHLNFEQKTFNRLLQKISVKHLSPKNKALYLYLSSFAYLQEADMMSASQNASKALDIFQKKAYFYEEAAAYLLLAEIYRISCVNDIAQTMIESALKIYQTKKLHRLQAQTTTILGMLMVYENRFEEAADKYRQAISLTVSSPTSAEITNQITLLKLAQKDNQAALQNAQKAYKEHQKFQNKRGQAFSRQLLGHIYFNMQNYDKAAAAAEKAAALYAEQENFSAYAECLYLKADALCKLHKDNKAEPLLREILKLKKNKSLNFHIANAYSLLGLIYLRAADLQRAKVLFQQSLHHEQSRERCQGIIADYANLALIETMSGNPNAARSNLEVAKEYADKTQDEDLIKLINEKILPLSNN